MDSSGERPIKRRMRAEDRRRQLVEVAQRVFVREGSAAPTKMIADEAGVHEALLFQHFGSKDGLFEAAVMDPLAELVRELHEAVRELTQDISDSTREVILAQVHTDMLTAMTRIVPLLGIALFSDVRAGREFYRTRLQPVLEEIHQATREGTDPWRRATVDPTVLSTATYGIHFAFAMQAMFAGDVDPARIGPRVADLLWLGQVGVEPPRE